MHHSWSGSWGYEAGSMVAASTFGDLFWTSSTSGSSMRSPCALLR